MSELKRQRVEADVSCLETYADDLRQISSSIGSYLVRHNSTRVSVPLQASNSPVKLRNILSKSSSPLSRSLYSVISKSAYAAKKSVANNNETWQKTLDRLAQDIVEKTGSTEALERCDRLLRRFEALSESVRLCQEKVRKTDDEVALQERLERQLTEEEAAWEQQMQIREERVAAREVELQDLRAECAADEIQEAVGQDQDQDVQANLSKIAVLKEGLALRAEEKRDIKAAIDSLQRKKARRSAEIAEEKKKRDGRNADLQADAAAAAREQVLRELREEKEMLQREIIETDEVEEKLEENVQDLSTLKEVVAEVKAERTQVQTRVDLVRLELARQKRKMRHMVDVQLLTARDTNPPTLREEAVLLHLLFEHEGEMGVNELKQQASKVLQDHDKPNGNGVVIRALYSLVANGLVQIDRSYGNGLVTLLLI